MFIGDWEVHPKSNELQNGDQSVRLSPLAMDILLHLASVPGEVVDTTVLIDRNWPLDKGSDNALYKVISELRKALEDKNRKARFIESVAKRGYRLTLEVKETSDAFVGHIIDHEQLLLESLQDGEARMAKRQYTLAIRHFEVLLDLCQQDQVLNEELETEANLLIGHCLLQEQGKDAAQAYFDRARELALKIENQTQHAKALLGLSGNLQPIITKNAENLRNQLQLAYLSIAKSQPGLALRLRSRVISYSHPIDAELLVEAQATEAAARALGDSDTLLYSLLALHECLRSLDKTQEHIELSKEIFALSRQSVDRDLVSVGYLRRMSDLLLQGQTSAAAKIRGEMEALQPKVLFQDELSRIDACLAQLSGDWDLAEQHAMAITFRESGFLLMQFLQLIYIARFRGNSRSLLPMIESVAASNAGLPAVQVYLAILYSDVGQLDACKNALAELGEGYAAINRDISWHAVLAALSEVAVSIEDHELAKRLLDWLAPLSGYQLVFTTVCVFGAADYYIGLLGRLLGRSDADDYLSQAIQQNERAGNLPQLERAQQALELNR